MKIIITIEWYEGDKKNLLFYAEKAEQNDTHAHANYAPHGSKKGHFEA